MTSPIAQIAVAGWVWELTTVIAVVSAAALLAALTVHLLASARPASEQARSLVVRHRTRLIAILPLVVFAAIVLVRLGLILAERPGP